MPVFFSSPFFFLTSNLSACLAQELENIFQLVFLVFFFFLDRDLSLLLLRVFDRSRHKARSPPPSLLGPLFYPSLSLCCYRAPPAV